jgi:hypothetical protein
MDPDAVWKIVYESLQNRGDEFCHKPVAVPRHGLCIWEVRGGAEKCGIRDVMTEHGRECSAHGAEFVT